MWPAVSIITQIFFNFFFVSVNDYRSHANTEKGVKQIHKSLSYYKVNPHVTTPQIKKRNAASCVVPPPSPQEYHHPDSDEFASPPLFFPLIVSLTYDFCYKKLQLNIWICPQFLAVINYAAVNITVHFFCCTCTYVSFAICIGVESLG